ncbi:hypothetical protein SIAM614_31251 [Roseibium aggregatum IAM 12614]|uniref:Uncharacterized protein n=1 Tax=Roseibium aggregatum (strain ATCC 25650 / DSM 13394 / JCM 20685 / NBRC 16684 / NCIMB 2208 / IAM 12614 / B1) TaxID=384765 RepID=A0NZG2_ROSAI|nr:hypothetical protein SIAM614_31251 [Roseibium aggregatum IAM 12614]
MGRGWQNRMLLAISFIVDAVTMV